MGSDSPLVVTYEDIDPVVHFNPQPDTVTGGWTTYFASGTVPGLGGKLQGVGNSVRTAQIPNASFQFTFFGTSVTLYGFAGRSSYDISIDSGPAQMGAEGPAGVLGSFKGLKAATHTVQLTLKAANPRLDFDRAVFDVGLPSATTLANTSIAHADASPEHPHWALNGNWVEFKPEPGLYPGQSVVWANGRGHTATLTFNGSAIYLYGNIHFDHHAYQVELDGEPTQYDGYSSTFAQRVLLFFRAGLDPAKMHTIRVQNVDVGFVDFEYATTIQTTPPSKKPSSSAAVIGGAVAGGIVFGVVVVALIYLFWRRRRRQPQEVSRFDLGEALSVSQVSGAVPTVTMPARSDHRFRAELPSDSRILPIDVSRPQFGDPSHAIREQKLGILAWQQSRLTPESSSSSAVSSDPLLLRASPGGPSSPVSSSYVTFTGPSQPDRDKTHRLDPPPYSG